MDGNLMWIVIGAVVLVLIIIVVVVVSRGKGAERNRDRASELRSRAAQDEQLITTRQDRAVELEREAEAAHQKAMGETDRAEALRVQAGEADEMAARAADEAEILEGEASHSRESLDEALEEHNETLREADRRDPDVNTDRHGNRIVTPEPESEAESQAQEEEVIVIPEEERLDIGDDYSGDEFAEPDAEYIDPVEHDRLAHLDEVALEEDSEPAATTPPGYTDDASLRESVGTHGDKSDTETDRSEQDFAAAATGLSDNQGDDAPSRAGTYGTDVAPDESGTEHYDSAVETVHQAANPETATPWELNDQDDLDEDSSPTYADESTVDNADEGDNAEVAAAPATDPYGNPVIVDDSFANGSTAITDETPRNDQGQLLDPYGNPVAEASEDASSAESPTVFDDEEPIFAVDDDLPRDEQGRRLDPYGNPVPENLQ